MLYEVITHINHGDYLWTGSECVSPFCDEGFELVNFECVPIVCPEGQQLRNNFV